VIKTITVEMNDQDFDYLPSTSMNWASIDWEVQDGRFDPLPDYRKFARAYWFESYANLLLARAYVTALGFESSTHLDEFSENTPYLLLTDFGGKI